MIDMSDLTSTKLGGRKVDKTFDSYPCDPITIIHEHFLSAYTKNPTDLEIVTAAILTLAYVVAKKGTR